MTLNEIRKQPTLSSELVDAGSDTLKLHESVFRSFHIVDKMIELCKKQVPHDVIIEIAEDLKNTYHDRPKLGGENEGKNS